MFIVEEEFKIPAAPEELGMLEDAGLESAVGGILVNYCKYFADGTHCCYFVSVVKGLNVEGGDVGADQAGCFALDGVKHLKLLELYLSGQVPHVPDLQEGADKSMNLLMTLLLGLAKMAINRFRQRAKEGLVVPDCLSVCLS
eukprot:g38662.t1